MRGAPRRRPARPGRPSKSAHPPAGGAAGYAGAVKSNAAAPLWLLAQHSPALPALLIMRLIGAGERGLRGPITAPPLPTAGDADGAIALSSPVRSRSNKMANDEDIDRLRQGVAVWNDWRAQNREHWADLRGEILGDGPQVGGPPRGGPPRGEAREFGSQRGEPHRGEPHRGGPRVCYFDRDEPD